MDSAVTFWHRHRATSEAKIDSWTGQAMLFPRSGAALAQACVVLVRNGFRRDVLISEPGEKWGENSFPGPAWPCGFTVATCFFVSRWNCKNQVTEVGSRTEAGAKTFLVLNGFSRDVLTSEPGEKWGQNSFPGPAWPCGFTVATRFFVSRWNCKNQVTEVGSRTEAGAKTFLVLNGFSRDVLTPAPGEKWGENSSLGPASPCCFPAPGLRWPRQSGSGAALAKAIWGSIRLETMVSKEPKLDQKPD